MPLNLKQVIQSNIRMAQLTTFTNLPAKVLSYNASNQTATVQPLINFRWSDGVEQEDAPVANVPVIFPSAGGGIISFPVEEGDTVLLCFSMRSLDGWKEGNGDSITPKETRTHDLNDAIAIPGLYPKQNSPSPSSKDVELKFKGNKVTLKPNGDVVIEGGTIEIGEGATQSVVLGDALKTYLDSHTHNYIPSLQPAPTPVPTTPPNVPLPPTSLSSKVKVL